MSRAEEFHDIEKDLDRLVRKIRKGSDVNHETLIRYYEISLATCPSRARVLKRLADISRISRMLGMKFEEAKKEDIVRLVGEIEKRDVGQWTKRDLKKILKSFYKWLRDTDFPPDEVRWIKCGGKIPSRLMKKDLLTVEEVNRLIDCADDIQDKTLFSVFFDSGRRVGEILGLNVGEVEFDLIGARLRVQGKVGFDNARIGASAPRLATWLDNHPDGKNPHAPLWVMRIGKGGRRLSYDAFRQRLRRAVAKSGIKKRVFPYLFRHSRYAPTIHTLTEQEQNMVFGWKPGSDAKQAYLHLADEDLDQSFLKMNGLKPSNGNLQNNGHEQDYVATECPRCKRNNSPDSKYCNGCGLSFDLKHGLEADQRKEDIKEKMDLISTELAKSPEVLDMLLDAVALLKHTKRTASC